MLLGFGTYVSKRGILKRMFATSERCVAAVSLITCLNADLDGSWQRAKGLWLSNGGFLRSRSGLENWFCAVFSAFLHGRAWR